MSFNRQNTVAIRCIRDVAETIHEGQKYGEQSYFDGHLRHVAGIASEMSINLPENERVEIICTAYLHDAIEDSKVYLNELETMLCVLLGAIRGERVGSNLRTLTRAEGHTYTEYINLIKNSTKHIIMVKRADLLSNLINPKKSLITRYLNALTQLS